MTFRAAEKERKTACPPFGHYFFLRGLKTRVNIQAERRSGERSSISHKREKIHRKEEDGGGGNSRMEKEENGWMGERRDETDL